MNDDDGGSLDGSSALLARIVGGTLIAVGLLIALAVLIPVALRETAYSGTVENFATGIQASVNLGSSAILLFVAFELARRGLRYRRATPATLEETGAMERILSSLLGLGFLAVTASVNDVTTSSTLLWIAAAMLLVESCLREILGLVARAERPGTGTRFS